MNYRMIRYTLGWILLFEAAFLLVPIITAAIYAELLEMFSFLITAFLSAVCGILLIKFVKY